MGIRPLSAPIPNLSPRFPDHTIPRLSLGESTGIEKGQTSRLPARLEKTSPESRPDRKSVSTRNSYNFYKVPVFESRDQGSKRIVKSANISPNLHCEAWVSVTRATDTSNRAAGKTRSKPQ